VFGDIGTVRSTPSRNRFSTVRALPPRPSTLFGVLSVLFGR